MSTKLLAIDQGTTSSRAILFDESLKPLAVEQKEFPQAYPRSGWVEHDPEDLWNSVVAAVKGVLLKSGTLPTDVAALGITNQRETTIVWDRASGKPIYNAIVWQDRRTAEMCEALKAQGVEADISAKTGLRLDPYFSATKIAWLLDNVPGARVAAERGELAFGTVDSFLLWRLSGGQLHATDATNASRTLLYDLRRGVFDEKLLEIFGIPFALMPEIRDSSGDFGATAPELFGDSIRIAGIAGDQQAALIGQACFEPGMMKSTYGTGAFILLNTGDEPVLSTNRLLTTIAYQLAGKRTYALEGAIFVAGSAVKWLRDGLKIIRDANEMAPLAQAANDAQGVCLVPAFVGLGAPYWDANARGALFGITLATGAPEIARAVLEGIGFQTLDLLNAIRADWPQAQEIPVLRVDGGMVANDWLLQFLADILDTAVERPQVLEATALGAAYLAGLSSGVCPPPAEFVLNGKGLRRFEPAMDRKTRQTKIERWNECVQRVVGRNEAG